MNAATQKPQKTTTTDSLFGMALAQAFTGLAFGIDAEQLWEAGEIASAVRDDRTAATAQKRTNGLSFELGVKNSLTGVFAGLRQSLGEMDRATFRPAFAPSPSFCAGPAFA